MNKTFIVLITALFLSPLFSLLPPPVAHADWLIDRSGTLIKLDSRILGDDDEVEIEDESDDLDDNQDKSKDSMENQLKQQERARELARKASDKAKEELKKKIEINELKSKTSRIEKESEIEVEGDKLKIKQKIKDASGKELETELQLENGEELQVESKDGDDAKKFNLRARKDSSLELEKDGIRVVTKLPISLNENNELVVTRPDGTTKIVAVMPDQALKMLRDQNITPEDDSIDVAGDATGLPELEDEDGEPVYKIDGLKEEKVFGLFKIAYKTKAIVSAETGELVRTELSNLDRFMSIFSF